MNAELDSGPGDGHDAHGEARQGWRAVTVMAVLAASVLSAGQSTSATGTDGEIGAPVPDIGIPDSVTLIAPTRLLDTRPSGSTDDGQSSGEGGVRAGTTRSVQISGRGGVAADATGAVVNLAVIRPTSTGFATAYPCTASPPNAASLNFATGSNVSNAMTVKLSAQGQLCIFSSGTADFALDVLGFVPEGSDVVAVDPARFADTRPGAVTVDGASESVGSIGAGDVLRVRVAGRGSIPNDAIAANVNLAAVRPTSNGFATLYPCTDRPPNAASLNFAAGSNISNATTAKLSTDGDLCIFSSALADFTLDVVGYTRSSFGVSAVDPARLLDTRPGSTIDGENNRSSVGPGYPHTVRVMGRGGAPAVPGGAIVNLAVVNPSSDGYATLYPCERRVPNVASLNFSAGTNVSNATYVKLDGGALCLASSPFADYVVDLVGYVTNGTAVTSHAPIPTAAALANSPTDSTWIVDAIDRQGGTISLREVFDDFTSSRRFGSVIEFGLSPQFIYLRDAGNSGFRSTFNTGDDFTKYIQRTLDVPITQRPSFWLATGITPGTNQLVITAAAVAWDTSGSGECTEIGLPPFDDNCTSQRYFHPLPAPYASFGQTWDCLADLDDEVCVFRVFDEDPASYCDRLRSLGWRTAPGGPPIFPIVNTCELTDGGHYAFVGSAFAFAGFGVIYGPTSYRTDMKDIVDNP